MSALVKEWSPPVPPVAPTPPVSPTDPYDFTTIEKREKCYPGTFYTIYDPVTGEEIGFGYLPGFCTYEDVPVVTTVPGSPGSPGDPGSPGSAADYHEGWNAGAHSYASLGGNGRYRFKVPSTSYGVITGFGRTAVASSTAAVTHGFYVAGGQAKVIESGAEKGDPFPVTSADELSVTRIGTKVYYFKNTTRVYESTAPLTGTIWANAALFRGQDEIVDAAFDTLDGGWADVSTTLVGTLGNLEGFYSDSSGPKMAGHLSPLVGEYSASADNLRGTLGRLVPSIGGGGLAAILEGSMGQLVPSWTQAMLLPTVGELYSIMPGLAGHIRVLVGNAGGFDGTLGNLEGYFTNVGYAVMQANLGQLVGAYGTPHWLEPTKMAGLFTMMCDLSVKRAFAAEQVASPAMTTTLEVDRVINPGMTAIAVYDAHVQVYRTLMAVYAAQFEMYAALQVARTLDAQFAVEAAAYADLDLTRTVGASFVSSFSFTADLAVQREIRPELDEITISPNPNEGVVIRPPDADVEVNDA